MIVTLLFLSCYVAIETSGSLLGHFLPSIFLTVSQNVLWQFLPNLRSLSDLLP